jgi:hypothetical protein
LEQMVKLLNTELSNKRTLLEERVARLEQVNHVRKAESRKRKESCDPLSDIQGARFAWSTLLGGRGATLTQAEDIPLWSDEEEEIEEEVQVQRKQPKDGTQPQATEPTCSKLYCANMTIAFKNGKRKKTMSALHFIIEEEDTVYKLGIPHDSRFNRNNICIVI